MCICNHACFVVEIPNGELKLFGNLKMFFFSLFSVLFSPFSFLCSC